MKSIAALVFFGWFIGFTGVATSAVAENQPFWSQTFSDIEGKQYHQHASSTKAVIWIFILEDCPISNAYSPEINRLIEEYQPEGIQFFLIHSNPKLTLQNAKKHRDDYGLKAPIILDHKHAWVHFAGATVTPEAVVFDAEGNRLYLGRIDDRFPAFGKRRSQPIHTELRDAIQSILSKKPIAVKESKAIGCYIPPLTTKP